MSCRWITRITIGGNKNSVFNRKELEGNKKQFWTSAIMKMEIDGFIENIIHQKEKAKDSQ